MPWIIEYDHLDECEVRVVSVNYLEKNDAELTQKFRIYDDDGVLYYSGRMHPDDQTEQAAFAPLDAYGTPNAGATEMRLWANGKWVTL